MSHTPRLTIGMPVRNGARFLVPALESILSQKYDDFRLLILDNDSTDATDEICRDFAARDSRVDYRRNSANIGAARNFSRVFELAEGAEYFKWAACDDVLAPEYLDRCIAALDHDPTLVLCQSSTIILDCDGNPTDRYDDPLDGGSRSAFWRFHTVMWTLEAPYAIFGVARWDALRRTGLIRRDFGTDRACLAELSLQGRFHILPDPMFFQRGGCGERTGRDRYWWDPANRGRLMLRSWRLCGYHLSAARAAGLPPARTAALMADVAVRFAVRDWRRLLGDLRQAGRQVLTGRET